MARTLDQIISEIGSPYSAQVKSLQKQASSIPEQIAAQEAGLKAQQDQSFQNITNTARRRGLGFSGIPLAEQAQYTATNYLPALAQLRQAGVQQATSLQDAINSVIQQRNQYAQDIRQQELNREESARQAAASLAAQRAAAAAAAATPTLGSLFAQSAQESAQQQAQNSELARQQNIYSRAQSLQNIWNSGDPGTFNSLVRNLLSKGDDNSKDTIVTAYKLIGKGNANALKKWGLI